MTINDKMVFKFSSQIALQIKIKRQVEAVGPMQKEDNEKLTSTAQSGRSM